MIVRRCERRIGQLVRMGQERGEIRSQGQIKGRNGVTFEYGYDNVKSPHEAMGLAASQTDARQDHYAMADVSDGIFERAIEPLLANACSISWGRESRHLARPCGLPGRPARGVLPCVGGRLRRGEGDLRRVSRAAAVSRRRAQERPTGRVGRHQRAGAARAGQGAQEGELSGSAI